MNYNEFQFYFFVCLLTWCLHLNGFMFEEEITDSDFFTGNGIEENTVAVVENDAPESMHSEIKNTSYILSKPQNLSITAITDSSMDLSWVKPLFSPQDEALEYYVYYLHLNKSKTLTKRLEPSLDLLVKSTLTNLEPFALYKIWVKAKLNSSEGESSEQLEKRTDVSGPGPPVIMNATCVEPETLAFSWQSPPYNKSLDSYIIEYRDEDSFDFKNISVRLCNNSCIEPCTEQCKGNEFRIHNLTSEMYEIKIKGVTRSIYYDDKEVLGRESPSKKVPMNSCGLVGAVSAGVVAGVICACFALLLAIIAFVIWRNCLHVVYYYYLEDPPLPPAPTVSDWDSRDPDNTVSLARFGAHVAELHADGDIGFSKEYEAIQAMATQLDSTTEHSQHPENKLKNRYLNILAYDHSRVKLLPVSGQNRVSDYINANYIDGFQRANAYIGTQGPLPCTFDAFWRMIWEQGVAIIVMITNLVERGRRKCDMYWPKEGVEMYGSIQVKLIKEDILAMYTVRTLQIVHSKAKKKKHGFNERLVYQYHYTNWPDHGTPDHPLPILSFVKKSSDANPSDAGPIVVHCSAGVGRTGTYIVLDAMLKQIRHKNEMNIYGFLRHIRTQRNFLVQTEEQYIFIHDALLEAITCSETGLSAECLAHLLRTCSLPPADNQLSAHWHQLQLHFQAITAFQPKDYNLMSANKASNQLKNRDQRLVPVECSRVHLTPKPGVDGSDYINASWCLGFKKLREFIMTQHPLASTVLDFWQMVWDHNAQTVVLLSPLSTTPSTSSSPTADADPTLEVDADADPDSDSAQLDSAQTNPEGPRWGEGEPEYCVFWPSEGETLDGENFRVRLVEESELEGTVSRDLTVQSLQDDYELAVRVIQSPVAEPLSDLPALLKLLHTVQQWHLEYQNGPIVVVDRYGGTEAATFCCLATLMKQLDYENVADVCMYAKLYHNRRPGVWRNMDDYLLLYQALEVLSASKGVSLVASPSTSHSLPIPNPHPLPLPLPLPHTTPNGYTTGALMELHDSS